MVSTVYLSQGAVIMLFHHHKEESLFSQVELRYQHWVGLVTLATIGTEEVIECFWIAYPLVQYKESLNVRLELTPLRLYTTHSTLEYMMLIPVSAWYCAAAMFRAKPAVLTVSISDFDPLPSNNKFWYKGCSLSISSTYQNPGYVIAYTITSGWSLCILVYNRSRGQ